MTTSLEGWSTKVKEAPPHEVRVAPLDTDPEPNVSKKENKVYKFACASCSSSYIVKLVILKPELRKISKRIISLIFLNIYTPEQHALTHLILFLLK